MRIYLYFLLLFCLIVRPGAALAAEQQMVEITVADKVFLINVCKKYLEHPEQWPTIARINKLGNPNKLMPGQVLQVPVEMLKGVPVNGMVTFIKGTVSAPAKDASFRGRQVAFAWQHEQNASGYQLQVAADSEFHTLLADAAGIKESSYQSGDLPFGAYHYRLRSLAKDGFAGEWSPPRRFSLIAPPAPPRIEKLAVEGKEGHIRWDSLGEGIKYHLQVARDEAFREITMETTVATLEMTLEPSPETTVYYVMSASAALIGKTMAESFPCRKVW